MAAALVLVAAVSWADLTTPTVALQLQSTPDPHFGPDSTFNVLVTLADNAYTTAPLGAYFRVYFDGSVSTPTAILGSIDMNSALMGPVEGTVPNNWFDIAVTGPGNTDATPDFCTLTFKVLQYLNSTSTISLGDDPGFSNNLVSLETKILSAFPFFELIEKEIPHQFNSSSVVTVGPTRPPTAVSDWYLFR